MILETEKLEHELKPFGIQPGVLAVPPNHLYQTASQTAERVIKRRNCEHQIWDELHETDLVLGDATVAKELRWKGTFSGIQEYDFFTVQRNESLPARFVLFHGLTIARAIGRPKLPALEVESL